MKVKLSQIKPNPFYDGKYTTREIDDLVDAMEMAELQKPIEVTNDLIIINGYKRYLVAKFLGWEEMEVIFSNKTQENPEYFEIPSSRQPRKKSTEVLNEIQKLYQNYSKPQEDTKQSSGTTAQNFPDNSRQVESWYW